MKLMLDETRNWALADLRSSAQLTLQYPCSKSGQPLLLVSLPDPVITRPQTLNAITQFKANAPLRC